MAKSTQILVEQYTIVSGTQIQLTNYTSAQQIQLAYVFNVTQKKLYYAPTEKYATATMVDGLITIPTAAIISGDIIHIQIWDNVTLDEAYDSQKVLVQNPDSNTFVLDSLYDGATTTETATTAAQMTVAVANGRVILAGSSITNAGAGYTAGAHTILVEFNGGIGAIFSYTSTGTTLAGGTLALVSGGYGYTAGGTAINVMLCEELPSNTGMTLDATKGVSVNGLLHNAATPTNMKVRVMVTNEIDAANAANTTWICATGADVNSGSMVKEITASTGDVMFGLDFENLNFDSIKVIYAYEKTTGASTKIKMRRRY